MIDGKEVNGATPSDDENILSEGKLLGSHNPKYSDQQASTEDLVEEATETSSKYDNECDEDNMNNVEDMSTFKYTRIGGSLPRENCEENSSALGALSNICTSTKIGRIRLPREEDGQQEQQLKQQRARNIDLSLWQQPHYAILSGFDNGTLSFVDIESGKTIIPENQLKVSDSSSSDAGIVDVSLDASANYLAAINSSGACAIWEVRYSIRRSADQTTASQTDVFSSFITTLAGQSTNDSSSNDGEKANHLCFKTSSVQCTRILYPDSSFGRPTCLLLDPSYKRRREKLILVGFDNGKLVLTKRGFFQLRSDSIIYQGTSKASDDRGIESLAWRGPLVAWADISGIKLFDVESMSRIAHIDRPAGARASLYPTISSLRPTLLFETCDDLLVTWGDCVMSMHIKEIIVTTRQQSQAGEGMTSATNGQPTSTDPSPNIVKRRQVECQMAWELDCVASGVAPLDKDHLIVLGLVPKEEEEEEEDSADKSNALNDLELQVISRSAGTVTYADSLPLIKHGSKLDSLESAGDYHLLSTFSTPRMENAWEVKDEENTQHGETDQDYGFNIFAPSSSNVSFLDYHLRWNLKMLDFDQKEKTSNPQISYDDNSLDSDDYGFIVRQPSSNVTSPTSFENGVAGPLMVIGGPGDFIGARTLTVDDAISEALSSNKIGLALQRAMRYKRHIRKHDINVIGDEFLKAVLCLGDLAHNKQEKQKLSIRRLELAAKSAPTLIGGDSQRWKYWIEEFSRIPGALFVLWRELPVRDPKLPAELYKQVLNNLYSKVEEMQPVDGEGDLNSNVVFNKAVDAFLCALSAWGPTHALTEKAKFHEYFAELQRKKSQQENTFFATVLQNINLAIERRLTQSAAGYLQLPSEIHIQRTSRSNATNRSILIDSSSYSLFHVPSFLAQFSYRLPLVLDEHSGRREGKSDIPSSLLNTKVAFDAFAELNIMNTKYEMALRCYLLVGHLFCDETLEEIERKAICYVNKGEYEEVDNGISANPYGFVIAMIEQHHLHASLLDKDFLQAEVASPLVSLVRLLGLEVVGDFLVEHCVPPPIRSAYIGSSASLSSSVKSVESDSSRVTTEGDETLPITRVAEQLKSSPKLLHWYLHLIFKRRPEMYVQFPTTAVPPIAVTELHKLHLDLYIEFAQDRDSAQSLSETELYNQERKTTPLLLFLKAALPLGGIQPTEVRRLLETKRVESLEDITDFPSSFALELAYVIENYGKNSEEESFQVLDLYLKGAKSVMLAVTYAQRNIEHASILWETIIQYCLTVGESDEIGRQEGKIDGTLFGSLLEVGALCGADLARLVSSIPQGMNIEGLRPRLVAAVADYRMKLKMHEASAENCRIDRICLLREAGHRSRRGMRQQRPSSNFRISTNQNQPKVLPNVSMRKEEKRRPKERPNRYRLSVRLPMR